MTALLFALLAGTLTVLAPCSLPVLPILLGASVGRSSNVRPVFIAAGFVVSFSAVALALSTVTQALGVAEDTLRSVAIGLLLVFGLLMVWPRGFEALSARLFSSLPVKSIKAAPAYTSSASGFILGATLGLVWTPCAGPVLGSILTLIATTTEIRWAAVMLLAYAVGAALPMLAIAYGGQALARRVRGAARFVRPVQSGLGLLVIGIAAAMYLQYDTLITAWLSDFYPNGQTGL